MAVTKTVRSAKFAVSKTRKASKPVAKRKSGGIRHGPGVLTKALGLEGWEKLEPVILAALASEEPLLLVGRHGAAKSFLLERLAEALELEFRCYNASLLNFDDLVGFPIPTEDKQSLRYISTPAAIWDAEVVFLDEINRTKPELQNKLFPIVHERRVQGVKLEKLRYRWAAMNPPPGDDDEEAYLGAEPLDPALADRFGFLVPVPEWSNLNKEQKRRILGDQFNGRDEFAVKPFAMVAEARRVYVGLQANPPDGLTEYLIQLEKNLALADLYLSARRMTTLHRNILAVQAARVVLAQLAREVDAVGVEWEESALTALLHSIPQLAGETSVDYARLATAHRQAWELTKLDDDDPWKQILEAVSSQDEGGLRTATALVAYLRFGLDRNVPGTVVETLAQEVSRVLVPLKGKSTVRGALASVLREIGSIVYFDGGTLIRDRYARNLLYGLLPDGYCQSSPKEVLKFFSLQWKKLDLDRIELEIPEQSAQEGKQ
jgi:MoxR-like ATPase